MANVLNLYDPQWYANEALIQLEKALGMAGRVYRGFDRSPQDRGSVINISRPSTFTAQDAPSTAQDLAPGNVAITLNKWREVKFKLTDKELTIAGEKIIQDHIKPAAYALANDIDADLFLLYKDVPWNTTTTAPAAVADITAARKVLFNNGVPMDDLRMAIDGTLEAEFLNLEAFSQSQGAGNVGVDTQQQGSLGRKFGFEVSASQNVPTHVTGVSADFTGTLTGAHAAGLTSITTAAFTIGGTFKAGDTLSIAGNAQRYAITADVTVDGGGAAVIPITPPLVMAYAGTNVVTVQLLAGVQNLAFHKNAFALAMAPLSTMGNELGAKIATAVDDQTGLALRSRVFYMPDASYVGVALDALWGKKTLDPNLAVRIVD